MPAPSLIHKHRNLKASFPIINIQNSANLHSPRPQPRFSEPSSEPSSPPVLKSMASQDVSIKCQLIPRGETAIFTPNHHQKVVHVVRHGQGTHNLFALQKHKEGSVCLCLRGLQGCPYLNIAHKDARLTERGRRQAAAAGACLLQTAPLPETAFVSPLWRTLETATVALSRCPNLTIPLIADETLRERNGVHVCDMRSPTENIIARFPNVDFRRIPPGPDSLFSPTIRETAEELALRGKQFFLSLRDRPERSFAVFSHSSFLYNTINRSFDVTDPAVTKRFETGEHRALLLTYV